MTTLHGVMLGARVTMSFVVKHPLKDISQPL